MIILPNLHKTGTDSRTFKIIDLGAAADLRVGINYIPKEFLLDPRYFFLLFSRVNNVIP